MNKIFAILFFTIHLFNIGGYRLFFSFAENAADEQMVSSLDHNDYNENDLLQIKYILNAPYITNNTGYERCDGQIEFNGVQYNYVKRMVKNDTLYLYCIPNQQKTALVNSKNEIAKQHNDNPIGNNSEHSILQIMNLIYDCNTVLMNLYPGSRNAASTFTAFNNPTTLKGFITKHLQPPDLFI